MWPPVWGHHYWFFRHAAGQAYKIRGTPLTDTEREQICFFIRSTCMYLPCPKCSLHCAAYMATNPPDPKAAEDLWKYDVQFHNVVNTHNDNGPKMQVSLDEAERLFADNLKTRGSSDVHDFRFDYWITPIMATARAASDLKECTPEEEITFRKYIESCIYLFPFAINNEPVRQVLLDRVQTLPFTNSKVALESITTLFNSICGIFGQATLTYDELDMNYKKQLFHEYPVLVRSLQIRKEDHEKMLGLQKEMHQKEASKESTSTGVSSLWKTSTIILAALLSVCILFMVLSYLIYRFSGRVPFCPMPPNHAKISLHP